VQKPPAVLTSLQEEGDDTRYQTSYENANDDQNRPVVKYFHHS
jgi:hypothetical protein